MTSPGLTQNQLAIISLLISASLWGLIWYPLRLLEQAGMTAVWSSLLMYLAAAVLTLPYLYKSFPQIVLTKDLLLLAIAAGVTNVAFVVALIDGEVMRVMLLFYLSPLWTVLIGRWWLKEKLSHQAMVMLLIAMSGAIVMLWNPDMGLPWPYNLADWLALIAGFAFSVNNVVARKLADIDMKLKTGVTWWGVVIIALLVLFWQQLAIPQVSYYVWEAAWLLGWFGIVIMTIAVLYGVGKLPVYRSAVIMLFELVVAAISSSLLTNEVMTLQEWLGGALILVAGYGVARSDTA